MYFPICDERRFRVKIMSMRTVVVKGDRGAGEGRDGDVSNNLGFAGVIVRINNRNN